MGTTLLGNTLTLGLSPGARPGCASFAYLPHVSDIIDSLSFPYLLRNCPPYLIHMLHDMSLLSPALIASGVPVCRMANAGSPVQVNNERKNNRIVSYHKSLVFNGL